MIASRWFGAPFLGFTFKSALPNSQKSCARCSDRLLMRRSGLLCAVTVIGFVCVYVSGVAAGYPPVVSHDVQRPISDQR